MEMTEAAPLMAAPEINATQRDHSHDSPTDVEILVSTVPLDDLVVLWPEHTWEGYFRCPSCHSRAFARVVDDITWECAGNLSGRAGCGGGTVFQLRAMILQDRQLLERFLALVRPHAVAS